MNNIFLAFQPKENIWGRDYNMPTIDAVIKITFGYVFSAVSWE